MAWSDAARAAAAEVRRANKSGRSVAKPHSRTWIKKMLGRGALLKTANESGQAPYGGGKTTLHAMLRGKSIGWSSIAYNTHSLKK